MTRAYQPSEVVPNVLHGIVQCNLAPSEPHMNLAQIDLELGHVVYCYDYISYRNNIISGYHAAANLYLVVSFVMFCFSGSPSQLILQLHATSFNQNF